MRKGQHMSEEQRRRDSESHKGKIPWNKGIPCSEETKMKIGNANRNPSEETRRKLSEAAMNRSPETLRACLKI